MKSFDLIQIFIEESDALMIPESLIALVTSCLVDSKN